MCAQSCCVSDSTGNAVSCKLLEGSYKHQTLEILVEGFIKRHVMHLQHSIRSTGVFVACDENVAHR